MNVKELSYVIKTTFGAPLDVRYVLSSMSEIMSELPQALRYLGQLVYIKDVNMLYIFKNGITNSDLVPFNQTDIVSVDTLDDALVYETTFPGQLIFVKSEKMYYTFDEGVLKPMQSTSLVIIETWSDVDGIDARSRYEGQNVYVKSEQCLYSFRGGVTNGHLIPVVGRFTIPSLSNIDTTYPEHSRKYGQRVWVEDIAQLRIVDKNKKLIKFQNEIKSVSSNSELAELAETDGHPYIVINSETGATLVWSDKYGKYVNINHNLIQSADTVEEMLEQLSADAEDQQRIEGQLYYIRSLGEHYTFVGGIANSNFVSIKSNYIVDSLTDLDRAIPTNRRYVGQQFYVLDEAQWYFFKDRVTYQKINGFTQSSKTVAFSGDYEYVHERNISSILISITNSRGELVDVPWKQGYVNTKDKTDAEIAFGQRNVISLSTDIYDTYTITILSV